MGLLRAKALLFMLILLCPLGLAFGYDYNTTSNMNVTNVSGTFGEQLGSGLIGSNDTYGDMIIGLILLIIIIVLAFTSRLGLLGATVVIIPAVMLMAQNGYMPQVMAVLLYIVLGCVWGAIMIRGFGVR